MNTKARVAHVLTLCGYLGTLILLVAWYGWLAPSAHFPVAMVLLVMGVPLLFPLRGLLHGRRYTVAWSLFLSVVYFCHGLVEAYSIADARALAIGEVLATTLWFVAGIFYVRNSSD